MYRLSDNYYHRKCYFAREQGPTQTVMKNIMTKPLAEVYFKSMNRNLKIKAGLEPPLKGGGSEWYQPPEEQLARRAVLKPVSINDLKKFGFDGLNTYGEKIKLAHYESMRREKKQALEDSDIKWKHTILCNNKKHFEDREKTESLANSMKIRQAVDEFELMYRTSLIKMEEIVMNAAAKEVKRIKQDAYDEMNERYKKLLHYQFTSMLNDYEEKLKVQKEEYKANFLKEVEKIRMDIGIQIRDINYEKHSTIEKLRHFLQCRKLVCEVYVALKEKEETKIRLDKLKQVHQKKIERMKDDIQIKDCEINLEKEDQKRRQEFIRIWKKKICHVVKKFQLFVEYCLMLLPEQAEFFLNLEKLMMLQLAEATENPVAPSSIEYEERFVTPVPQPHPFYLVCNKGYKPKLNQDLCPVHCTSSASQFPVLVINERCIYAACDNFEVFNEKVCKYIYGDVRGDDSDVEDQQLYEFKVPVKYTSSTRLQELKLESSLMQILQNELPNPREFPVECSACKIPFCLCSLLRSSKVALPFTSTYEMPLKPSISGNKLTKQSVLQLQREPKWESYLKYVEPKKCKCAKTAKNHLLEHLPPYMRKMSSFEPPELPNYEKCTIEGLKRIVEKAKAVRAPTLPPSLSGSSGKRDVSTQYSDPDLDYLCTCFSDDEISKLFKALKESMGKPTAAKIRRCTIVDASLVASEYMNKTISTFATDRAFSLRNLLDNDSELEEIFKNKSCDFDK